MATAAAAAPRRLTLALVALAGLGGCQWWQERGTRQGPVSSAQKSPAVEEGQRVAAAVDSGRPAPGIPSHVQNEAQQIGRLMWFWFSRRDGAPPEGERAAQIAAFLPAGYTFGCDGGERHICPRFREPPGGPRPEGRRPGNGGRREGEGNLAQPPNGPPPGGPRGEHMDSAPRHRPEGAGRLPMLLSFRFQQAAEAGYTTEQLDHLAVGLAIQTRILAQACLPGRPGHPPASWREIAHHLKEGLWSQVRDAQGEPMLSSLLLDYAEESGPATVILLHQGTPIQAVRILRTPRRLGCKAEHAAAPGEVRERVLRHLDQDGDGLVGPEEVAAFRHRRESGHDPEPHS